MIERLERPHDAAFAARPAAQVTGYFGEGLPASAKLWSKCGNTVWTNDPDSSWRRHDAALVELENGLAFILAAFTEGEEISQNTEVLPALSEHACRLLSA